MEEELGRLLQIELILCKCVFFLMIRRPPRSTQGVSSAASDVYKRQILEFKKRTDNIRDIFVERIRILLKLDRIDEVFQELRIMSVSYTHLRAHETSLHLVCRLLLEKKKKIISTKQT
eukprot:TRINITY_DN23338_c0_g1_i1.p1 TRINITY_DN23338_c0_g1~~TRINITY_DN23338_c0_g1_i1.p1  ORF type:complete len:118 (-),score=24.28 TRINITY_DN23338_c0_g1_i1:105-458(-)